MLTLPQGNQGHPSLNEQKYDQPDSIILKLLYICNSLCCLQDQNDTQHRIYKQNKFQDYLYIFPSFNTQPYFFLLLGIPRTGRLPEGALEEGAPILNKEPPAGIPLPPIPLDTGFAAPKLNPPPPPGVVGVAGPL